MWCLWNHVSLCRSGKACHSERSLKAEITHFLFSLWASWDYQILTSPFIPVGHLFWFVDSREFWDFCCIDLVSLTARNKSLSDILLVWLRIITLYRTQIFLFPIDLKGDLVALVTLLILSNPSSQENAAERVFLLCCLCCFKKLFSTITAFHLNKFCQFPRKKRHFGRIFYELVRCFYPGTKKNDLMLLKIMETSWLSAKTAWNVLAVMGDFYFFLQQQFKEPTAGGKWLQGMKCRNNRSRLVSFAPLLMWVWGPSDLALVGSSASLFRGAKRPPTRRRLLLDLPANSDWHRCPRLASQIGPKHTENAWRRTRRRQARRPAGAQRWPAQPMNLLLLPLYQPATFRLSREHRSVINHDSH